MLTAGCREAAKQPLDEPPEQDLRITFGGFLDGGDEKQKVEGTCSPDSTQTALSCEIYNGLLDWQVTELVIRVTWTPYSQDNVRDFDQRVLISPRSTASVNFKWGTRLPNDTIVRGRALQHWEWLVVGVRGIPSNQDSAARTAR